MVFDFLDFPEQLEHQDQMWGRYSPMFGPYTSRGLPDLVKSPAAERLLDRVDPFRYIAKLRMPKLIILGANDPYWTIDAITIYWDKLPGPKAVLYVPNANHSIKDEARLHGSLAAFVRIAMAGRSLPNFTWNWIVSGSSDPLASGVANLILRSPGAISSTLWVADSSSREFAESRWNVEAESKGGGEFRPGPGSGRYRAVFGEAEYEIDGIRCFFSTTPVLIRSR
jgi:PhoPQ-activated pathogenicity-related protein